MIVIAPSVRVQALIDEDRLLSRLEVMGNQLQAYSKVSTGPSSGARTAQRSGGFTTHTLNWSLVCINVLKKQFSETVKHSS